jgi:hypothetical protein
MNVGGLMLLLPDRLQELAQGVFFISVNAPTYDEALHLAADSSYIGTSDFRLEPQNPPLVKELLARPLFLVHRLPFDPDNQRPESARRFNPQ